MGLRIGAIMVTVVGVGGWNICRCGRFARVMCDDVGYHRILNVDDSL